MVRTIITGVIVLVLSGCGGGGADGTPPNLPPTGTNLSGNGALGNIMAGRVNVLVPGGTILVSGLTADNGDFGPLLVPSTHQGPVIIEISPAADDSSFFECDYPYGCRDPDDVNNFIPFGEKVPYTGTLSAVVADVRDVNTCSINPLTTAVRQRTEQLGGIDAANIEQADSEMAAELFRLLGVEVSGPICAIPNVDLVNPGADEDVNIVAVSLSILNAGLLSLVHEDSGLMRIDDVVRSLADEFADDGKFDVSEKFNSGEVNAGELLYAIEQQVEWLKTVQSDVVDELEASTPDLDLEVLSEKAAQKRNEVAPVAPVISGDPSPTVLEDSSYLFVPEAADPDGDPISFEITNMPIWASFDHETGTLSGVPSAADIGISSGIVISVFDGTSSTALPAFGIEVLNVNSQVQGVPVVTGMAAEDQTLTADVSQIADADGLGEFSYQWQQNGSNIEGATSPSYTLGDSDVNQQLSVIVSYVDGFGSSESVESQMTGNVTNVNDQVSGRPFIIGSVMEDATITADTSAISDADGLGSFGFQWRRNGVDISGATGNSYILGDGDTGTSISVAVSFIDSFGTFETAVSDSVLVENLNDSPTGQVLITGEAIENNTLIIDTSSITDADGIGQFSVQWQRNGEDVPGAELDSYILTNDDVGATISVTVTYIDGFGTAELLTSSETEPVQNINNPATGTLQILGSTTEDQTLSLDSTNIADSDGLGDFAFLWKRNGIDIADATSSTYTLVDDDVNSVISASISFLDGYGTSETITSMETAPIANVNDPLSGNITISGTPNEGQILTAVTSSLADADGLGTFSYQWLRNNATVAGAIGGTYTLVDADVGGTMKVRVTYTDGNGTVETQTSGSTVAVGNLNNPATGTLTINGVQTEDQTLTADITNLADIDGLPGVYNYQWRRNGIDIVGATANTYVLGDDDVGQIISFNLTYVDNEASNEFIDSVATAVITNVNDAPSGTVTIDGTQTEDQALTVNITNLVDEDGLPGVLNYQWQRNGVDIAGATANTYLLGDDDVAQVISVNVTYVDNQGTAEAAGSSPTGAITNTNDAPTGTLTVDGTQIEDQTLTANTTNLADADGLPGVLNYQWRRNGVDIAGATASTYVLGDDDVDQVMSFNVTYVDDQGTNESANSATTGVIANINDPPVISGPPVQLFIVVDQVFDHTPTITDADSSTAAGEVLTIMLDEPNPSGWITFFPDTGRVMGTPSVGDIGSETVTITVADDDMTGDSLTYILEISDSATITLSWIPPTTRANGDVITVEELDHYEVSYREAGESAVIVSVAGDLTSLTVPLPPGTYLFQIKVIDVWGLDSGFTDDLAATIDP